MGNISNNLVIWGSIADDYGSEYLGSVATPGFKPGTLNYAQAFNRAFRNATIFQYGLAELLTSINATSSFSIGYSIPTANISAFVANLDDGLKKYIGNAVSNVSVGHAATTDAFATAVKIELTGDVTGAILGTSEWVISTTIGSSVIDGDMIKDDSVSGDKLISETVPLNRLIDWSIYFKNGSTSSAKTFQLGDEYTVDELFGFGSKDGVIRYLSSTKQFVVDNGDVDYNTIIPNNYIQSNDFIKSGNYPFASIVGNLAFESCYKLSQLSLPNVQYVGYSAFVGCQSLSILSLPKLEVIKNYAFYSVGGNDFFTLDLRGVSSLSIGSEPFHDNGHSNVTLKACYIDNLISIPNNFFNSCVTLETLTFNQTNILLNCQVVGYRAFQYCNALKRVHLPNCSVLAEYAFDGCGALSNVSLNSSLTEIPNYAFRNCAIGYDDILSDVTEIGYYAFQNNGFEELTHLSNVTIIDEGAFANCGRLSLVSNLNKCRDIIWQAFESCSMLSQFHLTNSTSSCDIHESAFKNCSALSYFKIYYDGGVIPLSSKNAFEGTPMYEANDNKYIFVPTAVYNDYISSGTGGAWYDLRSHISWY